MTPAPSSSDGSAEAPAAATSGSTNQKADTGAGVYYLKIHQSWILWFKDVGSAVGLIILLHIIISFAVRNTQDFGLNIYLLRSLFKNNNKTEDP